MKFFVILILFFATLNAQGEAFAFKEKKGHFAYFVKLPQEAKQTQNVSGKKEVVYYKNGAITEAARFVTDDRIQIAFSTTPDLAEFEAKFALRPLIKIGKNVYVFENRSDTDDVALCGKLWEETGIEYARPLFKNKKRLQ